MGALGFDGDTLGQESEPREPVDPRQKTMGLNLNANNNEENLALAA